MKVKVEKLPKSRVKLSITVERPEMDKYINLTLKNLGKKYVFKGFRKGEAPREVVEKNLGTATLMIEAVETAINDSYMKAVMQEKLQPVGQAKVDVPEDKNKLTTEEVFFIAEVDVLPEFELPDYRKIAKKFPKKEVKVSKDDVKETVQRILNSRAKHTSVKREAKKDDWVDFVVNISEGGEEMLKDQKHSVVLGDLGQGIKEFHEALEGMKEGDKKKVSVKLPKDFVEPKLAGKKVECDLEVTSVTEVSLPEWNDELVKELTGGKFSKVDEMEKNIEEGLIEEKTQSEQVTRVQSLVQDLIKVLEVELPEVLIDSEIENILHDMEHKVSMQGLSMEKYYEIIGKKEEEYKKEIRPNAEEKLKMMLLLSKVADGEEIKADEELVKEEMQSILASYPKEEVQNIDMDRLRALVVGEMTDRMVIDFLTKLTEE
jgi:trigger factor